MFFMYLKLGFIVLFLFENPTYAAFYGILCFILWIGLKQPKYTGKSKIIKTLSPTHFFEEILGYQEDDLILGLKADQYYKKQAK